MKHNIFIILLIWVPILLSAQEENDSTRMMMRGNVVPEKDDLQLSLPDLLPEKATSYPSYSSDQLNSLPNFSLKKEFNLPYPTNPTALFRGDYHTDGALKQFAHGSFFGSGGQTSIPGFGRINDASLGYQYVFNQKLTLQLQANAMKINKAHFAGQSFSTSGSLLYRPSEGVTFKVFGSYDIGNSYGMSTHSYGATMSVDMSDRFGVEMGAQRYYNDMRGQWETVPIVIPYYRFENFTLGLDVGGLVYEILREFVFDKGRDSAPTIGPPRFAMPPMR